MGSGSRAGVRMFAVPAIVFITALTGMGITQTHLKGMPQLVMMAFGVITLLFLIAKPPFRVRFFFYILLAFTLYFAYYMIVNAIANWINPNDGVIMVDGVPRRVMQRNWLWGWCLGFILSAGSVWWYYRRKQKSKALELGFTILFLLITAVIYVIYELL